MNDPLVAAKLAPQGGRTRLLQIIFGVVISGVSIWLVLRRMDLEQVGAALATARWLLLVPAVAVYFVSLSVRAWRWSILLRVVAPLSPRQVFPATVLGYAGNAILPGRLGELIRAAALRRYGVPVSAALGSIAAERILDGLVTVGILLLAGLVLPTSAPPWLGVATRIVGLVFAGFLVVLLIAVALRPRVTRVAAGLGARWSWLARPLAWFDRFVDGLGALHSPRLLAAATGVTLIAWAVSIIEYWFALQASNVALAVAEAAFAVSATGLSTAVPAAPGYVGTQELAGVTVLGLFGIAPALALAATVTFHLVEILPVTMVGMIIAWRQRLWRGGDER